MTSKKKKNSKKKKLIPLIAYTDEAGNTGENLFDQAQPLFWAGTLFCTTDLESLGKNQVQEWTNDLGVKELHGSHIGLKGLERVATKMLSLLEEGNCHFHFTRVEKRFLATTKLTYTLLDSTANKSLSHEHFFTPFRGLLELGLFPIITYRDCKDFWEVFKTHNLSKFINILERLQLRVLERIQDPRIKQLLDDAIRWAILHPKEILETRRTEADSPNLVAFGSLFDHTQEHAQKINARIVKFYHDEQKQFMTEMFRTFKISSRVKGEMVGPLERLKIEQSDVFKCPFEMVPSTALVGLQLIDCILWLFRKADENGLSREYPECRKLLVFVEANCSMYSYDFQTYSDRVRKKHNEIKI